MANIEYNSTGMVIDGQPVSWATIDAERNKIRFSNSVLVTVSFGYGRDTIESISIFDKDKWAKIKESLKGFTAEFSEFSGKHSVVSLTFWEDVKVVENDSLEDISSFHAIYGFSTGDLDIVYEALYQAIDAGVIDEDNNRIDSI